MAEESKPNKNSLLNKTNVSSHLAAEDEKQNSLKGPLSSSESASTSLALDEKFSEKLSRAWGVVEKSRHSQRPYTLDYLSRIFVDFEELRGDRLYGEDPALVCGVGQLKKTEKFSESKSVFFIGHQKGRGTKQKIERNFGMARPEGYRKACRVMDLAERFKKPLLTFIDTPGAYPGIGAEERGQSEAIATSIMKIFKTTVPTVGIVIGEGGSGGALAIGVVDRLLMLENSTYSVISPESCAAILWGSASESKKAALALKLGAIDVLKLGLCDEVIPEPAGGAHEELEFFSKSILERIHFHFHDLEKMAASERNTLRYEKFRHIDAAQHGQANV